MRKYFYFIAAIMALETASIGFSSYMDGQKASKNSNKVETICQSSSDSLIHPQTHGVGIRHVI